MACECAISLPSSQWLRVSRDQIRNKTNMLYPTFSLAIEDRKEIYLSALSPSLTQLKTDAFFPPSSSFRERRERE